MGWFSSLLHRQDVPRLLTKAAWITHQGEELCLSTSFTYWSLGISHKSCTGLWSPWNFKLQVGKLMHWHMFQALTCPLLCEQQSCKGTPPPSGRGENFHTPRFTRRLLKSCEQEQFQNEQLTSTVPPSSISSQNLAPWTKKNYHSEREDILSKNTDVNCLIYHCLHLQTTESTLLLTILWDLYFIYINIWNYSVVRRSAKRNGQPEGP